jgi:exosortase
MEARLQRPPISYTLVERPMAMGDAEERSLKASNMPGATPGSAFWLQAGSLAILIGVLYFSIVPQLIAEWWTNPNFSHGFLVPLFSAFVVWQNRKRLAAIPVEPSWLGLAVIAGSLGILVVGQLGAEFFLTRTSLLFLIAGLLIYFLGWKYFRASLFPWVFLFFMVPIPVIIFNQIAFPLQFMAARMASDLLSLIGIPVLRDGNIIQLPTMSLEVAEACSGIRSLMSLGALAVIYGYFLETRNLPRVLLALSAIPIAVAANAFRIVGTGLMGYYWSPDKAEGFFHEFSGWVIFVISIGLLLLVHGTIRWVRTRFGRAKAGASSALVNTEVSHDKRRES